MQDNLHAHLEALRDATWGKEHLRTSLIYNVTLTANDFDKLQRRLNTYRPSRSSQDYDAEDLDPAIAEIKLEVLTSASRINVDPTPREHVTVTLLDLRSLRLPEDPFTMPVIMLREEYNVLVNELLGHTNSVFLTGQPGIGNTYFLYYLLILLLLEGRTTIFQVGHQSYLFDARIVHVQSAQQGIWLSAPDNPEELLVALVDGDLGGPHPDLATGWAQNVQIIMVSSPKTRASRGWVKQKMRGREMIMYPWSTQELLIASAFLYPYDVREDRLERAVLMFGKSPQVCFAAARGPKSMKLASDNLANDISSIHNITEALYSIKRGDALPYTVFEVYPQDHSRIWAGCLVRPVSQYALDRLLRAQMAQRNLSSYTLYHDLELKSDATEVVGRMWQRAVHAYMQNLTARTVFTLKALGDDYHSRQLILQPDMTVACCGPDADFQTTLTESVKSSKPCYLFPLSKTFIAVDSVAVSQGQLLLFQMTTASRYPVKVAGLQHVQTWMKRDTLLERFRPAKDRPWPVIFVVPRRLESFFRSQRVTSRTRIDEAEPEISSSIPSKHRRTDDGRFESNEAEDHLETFWDKKIQQYLLVLDEHIVFLAYSQYLNPHFARNMKRT